MKKYRKTTGVFENLNRSLGITDALDDLTRPENVTEALNELTRPDDFAEALDELAQFFGVNKIKGKNKKR